MLDIYSESKIIDTKTRILPQIKIFSVTDYHDVDKAVNDYIILIFNETGNFPKIKVTSNYIAVIYKKTC